MPMTWQQIVVTLVIAVVVAAISFFLGITYRKKVAEKEISSAEEEARRIINEAIKGSESKKREALLEAKEEILRSRTEYEKEEKSRRADLQKQERRLQQKEENLDRKTENIEKKEEALAAKHAAADKTQEEIDLIKRSQTEMLERISGLTVEEAKQYLISQVEGEVTHETALKIKEIEARAKEEADQRAKEIVATAIQRCAADHASEITVSVVPLPNDEMKGRIIGREGRNIRTIETLTGVDLIIDDTPEAITVSCFEPVRREVARVALEKLIADGRIHPTHIEEMVEKAKREVDAVIKSEGERAAFETGVRGLHPEVIRMLGRLHYRTSYGQNVLQHSIEVSHIAGLISPGDLLQLLQTLDIVLQILPPGAGTGRAYRVRRLDQAGHQGLALHVAVVGLDGVEDVVPLLVLLAELHAQHDVGALVLVVQGLADVVEQARPLGGVDIQAQLRGHEAGDVPAPGGRIWRTISSVWRSWRRSPGLIPAWRRATPSRRAGRSASWSVPRLSARIRW